ncbi:MAG TPA: hypothetical protein VFU37_09145 [Pyrinomonadaceae bacterium]|nr:hypothetical protein [Pyrinomonadaceae bacterium]
MAKKFHDCTIAMVEEEALPGVQCGDRFHIGRIEIKAKEAILNRRAPEEQIQMSDRFCGVIH